VLSQVETIQTSFIILLIQFRLAATLTEDTLLLWSSGTTETLKNVDGFMHQVGCLHIASRDDR
jgi:hypothetical protein